ncbi:PGF-CTERM-anchored ABC transporter substrate-binding protein [Natrialba asiatica]|uniref:Periplasmic binding protein n=1 Tax=Natrialba asiatica (strain ATCC 700177 / DSM 12278 / JCM 9576 / FERM P-10747 / NBRC 102637 / 172P1) TaxID=29540 RepID=M0AV45_NATA1|nr:PGF-CTERM-anchored ABC transporter substrate-binding protein [Natrialba asiatica]ELZ01259.1 periplasmic binding protein [Natrialba asiatica DSM 12278]
MRRHFILALTVIAVVAAAVATPAAAAGSFAQTQTQTQMQTHPPSQSQAQAQPQTAIQTQNDTPTCDYPIEVTDATGETITIDEAPASVVALQASDAQTMFEIGAADRLDGLPYSPATSELDRGDRTDVGDGWDVDHEQVIAAEPDLVLAANATNEDDIETLREEAGLTVYHFSEAESIDDVRQNVFRTGELVGECEGAQDTVDWMDDQLAVVDAALEDADRPLAYYAMPDGWTAGSNTFVHDVLTTAGLENVAEEAGIEGYRDINSETVVDEDPEWIIYPDDANDEPPIPDALQATTAAEQDNVVAVNANQLNQPAPHVVSAVVSIVEEIHPEAYEEASAELESSPAANESGTDGGDDADGGDSIPGFGVPAAIGAALVTLTALGARARRR